MEEFFNLFRATIEFHREDDFFCCESAVLPPVIGSHGLLAVVKPSKAKLRDVKVQLNAEHRVL